MSWQRVKLGDFLKVRPDRFKPKDELIQGLKRIDKIDFSGQIFISDKKSNTDMILIKQGDLVISGINVEKGALAVYEGKEDITATIHYSSYEFDQEQIDIDFLKFFLISPEFLDAIKQQVSGGIKTEIKPKHLLPLNIVIPELNEQKEVVKKFSDFRSKQASISTELLHQLELVSDLRQAFLREAIQGKLVPQDERDEPAAVLLERIKAEKENLIAEKKIKKQKSLPEIKPEEIPFEIPNKWTWCRFQDIAIIESNLVSPFDYPNLPHVAPDNIEKNTGKLLPYKTVLEDEVKSANHYFFPKQLIYSKVRPKLNKVVLVDFEGLCSADMYPIKPLIESKFLQSGMLSEYFLAEVDKFDNRVKMPKINQNQLSQIPIPIPPLAEQKRIVEKLEKLMKFCDELETNIRESADRAETLLQVALKEALEPK